MKPSAEVRALIGKSIDKYRLANAALNEAPESFLKSLASFEDYFSANKSGKLSTLRSQWLIDEGLKIPHKQIQAAYSRSSSFAQLAKSSFVGGVVIGRPPIGDTNVIDVQSFSWEIENGLVTFEMKVANETISIGPFSAELTYQALIFASDGRPMVVTILNTELNAQRVLLHPALVDTKIGCEMIELDKFIFSYLSAEQRDKQNSSMMKVRNYNQLYNLARFYGLQGLVKESSLPTVSLEIAIILRRSKEQMLKTLSDPELFTNKTVSPLAASFHVYDPLILKIMKNCAKSAADLNEFGVCMKNQAPRYVRNQYQYEKWIQPPIDLQTVSGVREGIYKLDKDLQNAFDLSDSHEGTWPLNFMIQETVPGDGEPWRYAQLEKGIEQGISALLSSNENARKTVKSAQQFTVAQRLFKLGLEGYLGDHFPVEKLNQLADELQPFNQMHPTRRWVVSENSSWQPHADSVSSFLVNERNSKNTAGLYSAAYTKVVSCLNAFERPNNKACDLDTELEAIQKSCDKKDNTDFACSLEIGIKTTLDLFHQRQLAKALEIPVYDARKSPNKSPSSCRAQIKL